MFFSNLVGDRLNGYISRHGGQSFSLVVEEIDTTSTVRLCGDKIKITTSSEGKNLFEVTDNIKYSKRYTEDKFTYDEVKDSDENPIIVLATKGIKLYKDVFSQFDVLFVNNDFMIIALVYGACQFELDDGTFIPLQRCNEVDLDRKRPHCYYSARNFKDMVIYNTDGGWDKSYDMVLSICPSVLKIKKDYSIIFESFTVPDKLFNQEAVERRVAFEDRVAREKKKREEKEEAERKERQRIAAEKARIRQEEEEKALREKREAEAEEKRKAKEANSKKRKASSGSTSGTGSRSIGAEAFLEMINGLK